MSKRSENNGVDTEEYINGIIAKASTADSIHKADKVCAPGLRFEAGSCARLSVLVEMAKAYNASAQPSDKIRMSPNMETLNPKKYKEYLVYQIKRRVGDRCTTQKCWAKQEFIRYMEDRARTEYEKHTHRPDSPQGKFEWLSTFDINDVMAQYERRNKDFKFFGAVPMDFADLPGVEVGHIDYDSYIKKGITKMGIVFNLDDHDQPGSHWTGMFTDFKKGHIFYFDSFGVKPEQRVRALMRQQARYMESKGVTVNDIRVDYNKVQHQKGNSECGVYSLRFVIKMAGGADFDKLCSNPVSDEKINKCRAVYFDKYTKKKD
jgi:hypothetical protein